MRSAPRALLAIAAGVLAALAGASSAAAGTAIPFTAKVDSTIVYENEQGVSIEVGSMQSAELGRGAVIIRFASAGDAEEARMTIFTNHGTIKARTHVTREQQPDGTSTGTGSGEVTGGTNGFRGARGSFGIEQTVVPGQGGGPPPGVDPGAGPPPGEGGPSGGSETHFTLRGAILVEGPPPLAGGPPRRREPVTTRFEGELRAGELQFEGKGTGTFVGEFLSAKLTNGATVYTTEGEGVTGRRTGTMSIWTAKGRIEVRLDSTFTEQPDGTIVNNGTGTIVGGSDVYRGARGRFRVSATLDPDNPGPYTAVHLGEGTITLRGSRRAGRHAGGMSLPAAGRRR